MSTTDGDDVPRDPWGNPLPPEDRAPANPTPDDFPPLFPSDPPGGPPPFSPPTTSAPGSSTPGPGARPTQPVPPAWPGDQPTRVDDPAPAPPANPAWPGSQPAPPSAGQPHPGQPPYPGPQPHPGPQAYPGPHSQHGPGWGGPGVPPQGGYPQGWGYGTPWSPPKRDGGAIGALVCGIVSITCAGFLGIILGPVALVLGALSRKRIRESQGRLTGDGMAVTAIVLGAIGVLVSIAYLVFLAANPDFIQEFLDRLTTTTTAGG